MQVLVPQNGKLTIQTTGWNTNKGDYNLGVVKGSDQDMLVALAQRYFGTSDIPYTELKAFTGGLLDEDALKKYLTGFKIGIINKTFDSSNNFGIGTPPPSYSTINVEDPVAGPQDTIRDFNLGYHIDQIALYSKGSPGYKIPCGTLCTTVITIPKVPLYRYYDKSNGDHFYTTNKVEGDNAVASGAYVAEGIAGYVLPPPCLFCHIPQPPPVTH